MSTGRPAFLLSDERFLIPAIRARLIAPLEVADVSSVSNCMKCGSPLPDEGDCPRCTAGAPAPAEKVPSLLDRELNLDRRQPAAPPRVPSFAELSSTLKPPAVAPTATPKSPVAPKVTSVLPDFPPAAPKPKAAGAPSPMPAPVRPPPSAEATSARAVSSVATPAPAIPAAPANVVASNTVEPAPDGPAPFHAPAPTAEAAPAKSGGSTANGAAEAIHARPASRWRRFGAYLVDSVVVLGILAGYLWLAATVTGLQPPQAQLPGLDGFVQRVIAMESILVPGLILAVIVAIAYSAGCSILWQGRTLGRRLFGIRLVDKSGLGPSPRRTVIRALLSVLSFVLFLGGFWLALFDRRGQTLHDKLTSTFVVQPS